LEYIKSEILRGILEESQNENIEIKFVSEKYLIKNFKSEIFLFMYHTVNPEIEEKMLLSRKSNIIFLHTSSKLENVHTIRHDLYKGAYMATDYLIRKGYKRIGFISGDLSNEWFLARFEGYISAIRKNKIEFNMDFVKETDGTEKEDIKAFEELMSLPDKVHAIFCANDIRAIHILEYCNKKKIRVPEEVAICGFDNIPETEMTKPPLTTVHTEFRKIGKEAVKLAVKLYEGEIKEIQDIVIEPKLVERKTT